MPLKNFHNNYTVKRCILCFFLTPANAYEQDTRSHFFSIKDACTAGTKGKMSGPGSLRNNSGIVFFYLFEGYYLPWHSGAFL